MYLCTQIAEGMEKKKVPRYHKIASHLNLRYCRSQARGTICPVNWLRQLIVSCEVRRVQR